MIKVKLYELLERAVGEGIAIGYRLAHKHTSKPGEELIRECIEREVMGALCDVIDFSPAEETGGASADQPRPHLEEHNGRTRRRGR